MSEESTQRIDPTLLEWASERQKTAIETVNRIGTIMGAARELGVTRSTVQSLVSGARKRAALHGYAPAADMTRTVPQPFVLKGVSTYYDKEGRARQQWVKSRLDETMFREMVGEAVRAFVEDAPAIAAPPPPSEADPDIIPWLQIGDAHLGMLAHEAEVGKNFDLKIAEREICTAFAMLIGDLPPVERIVLNDLGDFTHYENFSATTEASGNLLDFDSRYPRMIAAYSRTMRFLVDLALTKARQVDVLVNQGNHSRTNDIWMAELLRVAYGATGRVNVLNNGTAFIGYRMGKTLVMVHHGDRCPPARLLGVMTSDFRADYGETDFHYVDLGHIHHKMTVKEHPEAVIESFNTLSPGDKWHHDKGYRSRQSMTMVLRSRTYGEVGRKVLPIQKVWDAVRSGHAASGKAYVPSEKKVYRV